MFNVWPINKITNAYQAITTLAIGDVEIVADGPINVNLLGLTLITPKATQLEHTMAVGELMFEVVGKGLR